jgi:hypothetical protein
MNCLDYLCNFLGDLAMTLSGSKCKNYRNGNDTRAIQHSAIFLSNKPLCTKGGLLFEIQTARFQTRAG